MDIFAISMRSHLYTVVVQGISGSAYRQFVSSSVTRNAFVAIEIFVQHLRGFQAIDNRVWLATLYALRHLTFGFHLDYLTKIKS